jgi:hypothetical protein
MQKSGKWASVATTSDFTAYSVVFLQSASVGCVGSHREGNG